MRFLFSESKINFMKLTLKFHPIVIAVLLTMPIFNSWIDKCEISFSYSLQVSACYSAHVMMIMTIIRLQLSHQNHPPVKHTVHHNNK